VEFDELLLLEPPQPAQKRTAISKEKKAANVSETVRDAQLDIEKAAPK
jgi:hypothetical protein